MARYAESGGARPSVGGGWRCWRFEEPERAWVMTQITGTRQGGVSLTAVCPA